VSSGLQEFTGKAMDKAKEVDTKCRAEVGGAEKGKFTWMQIEFVVTK
jgi:hypothetical protein